MWDYRHHTLPYFTIISHCDLVTYECTSLGLAIHHYIVVSSFFDAYSGFLTSSSPPSSFVDAAGLTDSNRLPLKSKALTGLASSSGSLMRQNWYHRIKPINTKSSSSPTSPPTTPATTAPASVKGGCPVGGEVELGHTTSGPSGSNKRKT